MDALELLKKDWKKQESNLPSKDAAELSKLIWKSSSSNVKWILWISIAEFVFFNILGLILNDDEQQAAVASMDLDVFVDISTWLGIAASLFFISKFYQNYRRIKTTDSSRELMENILRTRRWVRYYVNFNIVMAIIVFVVIALTVSTGAPDSNFENFLQENGNAAYAIVIAVWLLIIGVMVGFFWLFYKILYGWLLRRLKKNYKELSRMEV